MSPLVAASMPAIPEQMMEPCMLEGAELGVEDSEEPAYVNSAVAEPAGLATENELLAAENARLAAENELLRNSPWAGAAMDPALWNGPILMAAQPTWTTCHGLV
jgi:hypothetical protein